MHSYHTGFFTYTCGTEILASVKDIPPDQEQKPAFNAWGGWMMCGFTLCGSPATLAACYLAA
ncbi:MAG: hypothetical protein RBS68_14905 [Anaerolineales bacterium]|jgi:hypothetical protein|nr:hypothetical protein [Anaerolineales bacterium]